jgi:hypothetical protein
MPGDIFARIEMRIQPSRAGLVAVVALAFGALFSGDLKRLITPGGSASALGAKVTSKVPVVEVVFDELPTATLTNRSGRRIDRKRFPGFARLAASSTWYRNNTTVADFTGRAVPAIETGINPGYHTLPTFSDQPNSIFTLLGGEYRFNVSEPVTNVCPPSLCPDRRHKEHKRPAPRSDPGKGRSAGEYAQSLFVPPKPAEFRRWLKRIPSHGRSLNFIHFELPHEPFHFLPDGRSYNFTQISDVANHNGQKWAGGRGGTATTWQRHYIQTGYADTLTKRMIRRLRRIGIWRRALVIVTADHGISFDRGTFRRLAFPGNFGGIANPPLFIKYPGQTKGEVSGIHTRTIDIVPTTAQVLGMELPYESDGVPVSEEGRQGSIEISNGFKKVATESFSEFVSERRQVLHRAARQLGAHTGLLRLGPSSNLLGRRGPSGVGRSSARAVIDNRLDLENVRFGGGEKVPAFVNGTIGGDAAGKVIAIGINGRIVATCRAFHFKGKTRWGAVVPPGTLNSGSNSIGVYLTRGSRLVRVGGS